MKIEDLDALIIRWSDGSLSCEQARDFERVLLDNPEARHRFRRQANLDAALRDWAEERSARTPWPAARGHVERPRRPGWAAFSAAAAILLMAGAWWFWTARPKSWAPAFAFTERTAQGCAVLTQTLDARFGPVAHAPGETLKPGRFQLSSGWAQIEFFSGAIALLEGPAELEIVSSWEARCLSGKARVRVPPAAHGFQLRARGLDLVDLGTEFAVNAGGADQIADVHVFEGEVMAHAANAPDVTLRQGQSMHGTATAEFDPRLFPATGQLRELVSERQQQRREAWQKWSEQMRREPRLIAYYPLQRRGERERLVDNAAEPREPAKDGGAVGAAWTQGRWPGKDALQFKRPGDRVRLLLDGTFDALTLMCWVRVDSLDHQYNALLLTDGYNPGEPHWQIDEDGRLMFSIQYPDPANPAKRRNQIYYSSKVYTPANIEHWHHLVVAYDNQSGEAVQYFDGEPVSREVSPFHMAGRPLVFGPCELGNWGLPTEGHKFPIRNLDGCLDEFAIYAARLSDAEIRQHYEMGRPE